MTPQEYRKQILRAAQQYYKFQKKYPVNVHTDKKHVIVTFDIGENATVKEIIKEAPRKLKEAIELFIKKTLIIYPDFSVDSEINDRYQRVIEKVKERINQEKETVQKIQKIFQITQKYPDLVYRKNTITIVVHDQNYSKNFPTLFNISVLGDSFLYPVKNTAFYAILFSKKPFVAIGIGFRVNFLVRPMVEENIKMIKSYPYFRIWHNRFHELIDNIGYFLSLVDPQHPDIPKIKSLYSSGIQGAFELRNLIEIQQKQSG